LNAAVALRDAAGGVEAETFHRLLGDPNVRIRLVAAGAVLATAPADPAAAGVVTAALSDPVPRVRRIGLDVVVSLGDRGVGFLDALRLLAAEEEPATRDEATRLVSRLESIPSAAEALPPAATDEPAQ
jgi:HEAT repeat protein